MVRWRMSEQVEKQEGRQTHANETPVGDTVAESPERYSAAQTQTGPTPSADVDVTSLVAGLDPIDWVQLRLTAQLSPGQRIRSAMQAHAFAVAGLQATLRRRFPESSDAEIAMMALAQLTPVRQSDKEVMT
jgi:hypothetical protein